jgi:hypothetical protein
MIRRERLTMSGRKILELTPETKEDELECIRLIEEGKAYAREGLRDDSEVLGKQLSQNNTN